MAETPQNPTNPGSDSNSEENPSFETPAVKPVQMPELTEAQQQISRRLLDTFQFGLEEVNIDDFFRDRPREETRLIASCTEALALSDFCRGGCKECARSADPYSRKNRRIFACDPLIEFIHEHLGRRVIGTLRLYDPSDPLDYPDIIKLARYIEEDSELTAVDLLTSCPPGSEKVLEELLRLNLQKIRLQVSLLPSIEERQRRRGVFEIVERWQEQRLKTRPHMILNHDNPFHSCRDVKRIGRLMRAASPDNDSGSSDLIGDPAPSKVGRVEIGFACGDSLTINPTDGPCCSIHHLASSQFPEERALVPVDKIRRVYAPNGMLYMIGDESGFGPTITTMYPTHSTYYDLDNNCEPVKETSLRHIAIFIYSVMENIAKMSPFNPNSHEHLQEFDETLRTDAFSMPQDPEELEFYIKLMPSLILDAKALIKQMRSIFGNTSRLLIGHSGAPRDLPLWEVLLETTKQFLQSHAGALRLT